MKISPEELDLVIRRLKRDGRVFLSLDEVVEILREGRKPRTKFIVFTLDDGYKDNIIYGYPVFKNHNVPFCIYVTNSFPNRTSNLWWYALENLILKNHTLRLTNGGKLTNDDFSKKKKNFLMLRSHVVNHFFKDPIGYFRQLGEIDFDISNERELKCLTWREIRQMSDDPLVTIGSHTVNHFPLSKLDYKQAELEIVDSKRELELQLDRPIKHFAFPFGSKNEAGQREYEIAKRVGFDSIVTAIHGHVHRVDDNQKLDRIFLFPLQRNSSTLEKVMFWNVKSLISTARKIF